MAHGRYVLELCYDHGSQNNKKRRKNCECVGQFNANVGACHKLSTTNTWNPQMLQPRMSGSGCTGKGFFIFPGILTRVQDWANPVEESENGPKKRTFGRKDKI